MSFTVDTGGLRDFAKFLEGFGEDADAVHSFITSGPVDLTGTAMSTDGEGLFAVLVGYHSSNHEEMMSRASDLASAGGWSALAIDEAAYWYDECDKGEAERLESEYEGASDKKAVQSAGGGAEGSFKYHSAEGKLEVDQDDVDGLKPKVTYIEDKYREITSLFSPTTLLRRMITMACMMTGLGQIDPVDEGLQFFLGDWQAWASCALGWKACGQATKEMADNFDPGLSELKSVWEGKAADAAVEYFAKLQEATETESEAYAALYEQYKLYTELIYEANQTANDILNTLADIGIEAVLTFTGGGPVAALKALFDAINIWVIYLLDVLKMAETELRLLFADEAPESKISDLPGGKYANGEPPVYEHPKYA